VRLFKDPLHSGVVGRSFGRLRADRPLVATSDDLNGESALAQRGDDQAATRVGGIGLGMAGRTERHQAVEIEVRAPLGALDDAVDLDPLTGWCARGQSMMIGTDAARATFVPAERVDPPDGAAI
jgi:hypothetical protein